MSIGDIGLTLVVHLDLYPPEGGGRSKPISSGYRPLCVIQPPNEPDVEVGLCELLIPDDIFPGSAGDGRLSFSSDVSDDVRRLLMVGSQFVLAEGNRTIGTAVVTGIE